MNETVMIISGDTLLHRAIPRVPDESGYQIECVETGKKALELVRTMSYALVLVDMLLPDISGLDICLILKNDRRTAQIPIVLMVNENDETQIIKGIEGGADDYILKTSSPEILHAKIRFLLMRNDPKQQLGIYRGRSIELNSIKHVVKVKNKPVDLTMTEFKILSLFLKNPGVTLRREDILNTITRNGNNGHPIKERSIDIRVSSLRKKLGPVGECLKTIYGVGYRFDNT